MYDRLWAEVKPLYDQLHCYTRTKLNQKYGDAVQPATGPIRADLLGNMWAQEWGNIYDIVAPKGAGDVGYDIGDAARGQEVRPGSRWSRPARASTPRSASRRCPAPSGSARRSLGRATARSSAMPRPGTSTTRTICASRCAPRSTPTTSSPSTTNSATIIYQRAYNQQPYLYLNGANDGFHEAIGDFIALSITPEYLVQIGLLDRSKVPSRRQGHRPAAAPGDGQGRVPAVRPAGRQMALGRVRRIDHAGQLQPGLGRPEAQVSGHHAAGRADAKPTSIRAPSSTSRATRPMRATSSRGSCSSSSTRRPATCRAGRGRFTAAASTATRKSASG